MRQRFPDYTPAQVVAYIKENAEQRISSPDPNNTWGHGFLVLPPVTQQPPTPSAPGSVTITSATPDTNSLTVFWLWPTDTGGSSSLSFDLRYIRSDASSKADANWTLKRQANVTSQGGRVWHMLAELTGGTQYDVQVRAVNSAGEGSWSATVTGTPTQTTACATGGAVANAANNPELVSDCDTLLEFRDSLAGAGMLNWSGSTSIANWDGITVSGTPRRVTQLYLFNRGLTGTIPAELGSLTGLTQLTLVDSQLTGTIPSELGNLANLTQLHLFSNRLTGPIPSELGRLTNLQGMELYDNRLTGPIPTGFGSLTNLQALHLDTNQLTGSIPPELGRLTNLKWLTLNDNQLTGEIPPELGRLTHLEQLYLSDNRFTGCVLGELRGVRETDRTHLLKDIGIPYCDVLLSGLSITPATLTPQFGAYITAYTATASASRITVTPSNRHNVTFQYLDETDRALTDTDGVRSGHQVDLPTGTTTTIKVKVTSRDGVANRIYAIQVTGPGALGTPAIGSVIPGAGSLTVAWGAPSQTGGSTITAYDLRHIRSDAPSKGDASWTVEQDAWTGSGSLQYAATGLSGGTQYDVQLRAVNAAGDGPWSATAVGTTASNAPGAPTGLTATANGQTQLDLSWSAPSQTGGSALTGYLIEVSEDSSNWSNLESDADLASTSYSHTGLPAGSMRHYRVSAINSAGTGTASNTATGVTAPAGTPGAPAIRSVTPGAGSLAVVWSTPSQNGGSAITGYDLRHLPSDATSKGDSNWTVAQDVWPGSGALSYELTGLDGGTQYDLQVRAVNAAGDGSWSATATGTTTAGESPPGPPANAQYRREGTTAVLTWDPSAGATHYKVYYDDFGSPRCSLLSSGRLSGCEELAANLTGASYTHATPDEDTNYYWIAACNDAGCSEIDSGNPARFVDNRPAAPANAQYRHEGSTTVVSWDPSTGATHHKVYYDDFFDSNCRLSSGRPSFCELLAGNVAGTTYTHTSPDDDTNYYWITACNNAGCSDIDSANPAQFIATQSAATAPGAPTGLKATANGQTQIDLSWTALSNDGGAAVTGYLIEVSEDGSNWSDLVADTGLTSYSHTGLTAGSMRHYRVSAINSAGTGTASNTATGVTAPAGTPGAPAIRSVTPGAGSLAVVWSTPSQNGGSAITGYDLRHLPSDATSKGDSNWTVAQDVWPGSGALSYELTGLDGGTQYDLQVRAVNAAGDGSWSATATGTTTAGESPPGPPANAQYRREGTTAVLTWDPSAGATHYKVYYDDFGSPRCSLLSSGRLSGCEELAANLTGASYTHATPDEDTNYYWIAACNDAGCSEIDSGNPARFVDNRPAAPANAQYRHEGSTTVVSWDPSTGATHHKVYYDDFFDSNCRLSSGRPSFCELLAGNVAGTTYTHTSPDDDTNYYWITACNNAGCSDIDSANPAQFIATQSAATAPGAPTGLKATANGQTQIDLSWTALSNDGGAAVTGYLIEVSEDGSNWSDLVADTGLTSYSHTGLTAGSMRHYRVSAINSAGTGTASNTANATTGAATESSPDLVVDNTLLSANVVPGYNLSLNATARNQGDGSSAPTTLRYYRSTDAMITTSDIQVGTDPVDRLVPSGSIRHAIGVNAPSTPGTYYYGACVDAVPGESNAGNNCSAATEVTVRVVNRPPQIVGDIDDITVTVGESFQVDISGVFSEPNGEAIQNYGFTLRTRGILTGVVNTRSGILSLSAIGVGVTTVAVEASDIHGNGSGPHDLFVVTVVSDDTTPEANNAPIAVGSIPEQTIILGTELNVDVSPYFNDPDDDSLSYTVWSPQLFNKKSVSGSTVTLLLSTSVIFCEPTTVTVTAQDPGGLEATQQVTLRRVNNPPVASSGTFPPQTLDVGESSPVYMGNWFSDPDDCDDRLTYSAESSDSSKVTASASGNIVTIAGAAAGSAMVTVTARDAEGLEATLRIQVTVVAAGEKPGPPTGLTATASGHTEIDLSWSAPSDDGGATVTGYRIEVSTDNSNWSDLVANTNSTSTSYTHTGLTAGSTRYYRVSAINSVGTGPASDTDSATTDAATKSGKPMGLTATANGQTGIDLSWSVPSDDGGATVTGYRIEVSTDNSNWSDLVANTRSTATSYSHTGLEADSTRYYRVSAINSAGTGEPSNVANATTDPAPTPTPTPRPTGKAVTGSITQCSGEQLTPGIDSYRITIAGTVNANRAVRNVRVTGSFSGDFVGIDLVGDMTAGESASFSITGYVSESVGTCGADIEWLEIT